MRAGGGADKQGMSLFLPTLAAFTALFALTAPAFGADLEQWSTRYKVGDQELAVAHTVSVSGTNDIAAEEVDVLADYFVEQGVPVVLLEPESEPVPGAEASRESGTAKARKPAEADPADVGAPVTAGPNFKSLIARLRARGNPVDIIRISRDKLKQVGRSTVDLARFFAAAPRMYVQEVKRSGATKETVAFGLVHTVFQTSVKAYAWLAAPGVSPTLALSLAAAHGTLVALATMTGTAYGRTFGRTLDAKLDSVPQVLSKPDEEIVAKDPAHAMRRRVFNYLIYGTMAFVTGGGTAHLGLAALLKSLPALLIMIEGRALVSPLQTAVLGKEEVLGNGKFGVSQRNRSLDIRLSSLLLFCVVPLALMDVTGAGKVILDLGFATIRSYTVATLVSYLSVWAALKYAPDKLKAFLEFPERMKSSLAAWSDRLEARRQRAKRLEPRVLVPGAAHAF